ncbi:MAG TPA: cupin domain-containing protein, partial [Stellaceae bacterium]|nr:cupin domain-containing protein [Stellaceae bacterium]
MRTGIIALSLLLAGWAPAFAQSRTAASAGQQFAWQAGPPILPKGAQMTVISGDPAKEGPYAIRLKLPNNYVIPPHQHPTRAEITVLYGAYYLGIGDKLNKRR